MFEGRLPRRFQDLAPKIVETAEGHEVWEFDGQLYFQVGLNAVVGRKREDWKVEPTRFEEMRAGCYDIDARVKDMDINGVWAAVNFPSQITGFCGRVFSQCSDPELGLAVTKAWNDWFAEEWHAPYPERIVPMGITYLGDPEQGADEIRRNAERGFVAVTLPEQPHRVDMPNLFQGWWDPDHRRVRRDRYRDLPARRIDRRRRHAAGVADGAARRDAVRPAVALRLRRVALVGLRGEAPGPARSRCRRAASGGWRCCTTASRTSSTGRATASTSRATCARPRCCIATSGSAPSTTRRRSARVTPSASTT